MPVRNVLVVGGGAAGMLAALFAAENGARVTLLERNEKLGKKVYITGKGRCNITNTAEREAFMQAIYRNPRFMYASFAAFDNQDMIRLMENLGVPVKVERGNRVFPESDHASDVTNALRRALEKRGVRIEYNVRVTDLMLDGSVCRGAVTESGESIPADAVILCTGGCSYPSTGSTGDGYALAKSAGHTVQPLMPALTPIDTKESWPSMLAGLSLKNVALRAWRADQKKKKLFYDEQGEMMFTHTGVTGPLVLTLSSKMPAEIENVRMEIDLKPALDMQTLDARILRDFQAMIQKRITAVMDGLVPHNLGQQLMVLAGISAQQPVNTITQKQRQAIAELLKHLPLTPKALRGFSEAIVTRGGVTVREINPSTMESKITSGLYFAGELMDVDAQTGGYNLQIAFSSGALAGKCAALGEVQA